MAQEKLDKQKDQVLDDLDRDAEKRKKDIMMRMQRLTGGIGASKEE